MDKATLQKVATVSKLKLTPEEEKEFLPQLKEVLTMFKEINQVDTKNIKPALHPLPITVTLRNDIPGETLKDPLSLTKHTKDNYFKGPKVI